MYRPPKPAPTITASYRRSPDPLPFEVICPKNKDGHLVPRRARRTGNVFWGCSNYPRCDFTTNHEPLGGLHDADDGPLARKDAAIETNVFKARNIGWAERNEQIQSPLRQQ